MDIARAANVAHCCNFTRIFAVLWAIFCVWRGWHGLAGALAFFFVAATPMICGEIAKEKSLDLVVVQTGLRAWNEKDLHSDAAVRDLLSLIPDNDCMVVITCG